MLIRKGRFIVLSLHCEQRFDIGNSFSELLLHERFIKQFNHEGVRDSRALCVQEKCQAIHPYDWFICHFQEKKSPFYLALIEGIITQLRLTCCTYLLIYKLLCECSLTCRIQLTHVCRCKLHIYGHKQCRLPLFCLSL